MEADLERRIAELERRIAWFEDTQRVVGERFHEQDVAIAALEAKVRALSEKLRNAGGDELGPHDARPPHY
jgi:uncharacterized coiled-coil protein SlyX